MRCWFEYMCVYMVDITIFEMKQKKKVYINTYMNLSQLDTWYSGIYISPSRFSKRWHPHSRLSMWFYHYSARDLHLLCNVLPSLLFDIHFFFLFFFLPGCAIIYSIGRMNPKTRSNWDTGTNSLFCMRMRLTNHE